MSKTKIEWAEHTWNPIVGCTRVSEGCRNCYAERMSVRLSANPKTPQYDGIAEGGKWTGKVRLVESALDEPLRRRTPTKYFVCSMSDLFHERCEDEWIAAVFGVMAACPQHEFMVLTKRPARMREWFEFLGYEIASVVDAAIGAVEPEHLPAGWCMPAVDQSWPLPNVSLGVSVEDQETADQRIPHLLATPAARRFVSAEPLLGAVDLTFLRDGAGLGEWGRTGRFVVWLEP